MAGESEEQEVSGKKLRSSGAGLVKMVSVPGPSSVSMKWGRWILKHENNQLHCILLTSRNVLYDVCNKK